MPDSNLPETLTWYRDSVKWAIGLSTAALAAAASGVDKVQKAPFTFQVIYVLFVVASATSLFCAGVYYFALTNFGNTYERGQRIWKQRPARGEFNPGALETDAALATVDNHQELQPVAVTYRDDVSRYRKWHGRARWALVGTVVLVALALIGAALPPPKEPEKPPTLHYSIAVSGQHRGGDGKMHVHTFLVSETTGEVWQMICKDPNRVEFVRVQVEGLEIPAAKKPVPLIAQ
jgi:hypothetical protein